MLSAEDKKNQERYRFIMAHVRTISSPMEICRGIAGISKSGVYNAFAEKPAFGIGGSMLTAIVNFLGIGEEYRVYPPDAVDLSAVNHPYFDTIMTQLQVLQEDAEEAGLKIEYAVIKHIEDKVGNALSAAAYQAINGAEVAGNVQ